MPLQGDLRSVDHAGRKALWSAGRSYVGGSFRGSRRPADDIARPPALRLIPLRGVAVGIDDDQRKAITRRRRMPVLAVRKVQNLAACRTAKDDPVILITQCSRIFAGDAPSGSIARREGGSVGDDHHSLVWGQSAGAKRERDPFGQFETRKIERLAADILQLDELKIVSFEAGRVLSGGHCRRIVH